MDQNRRDFAKGGGNDRGRGRGGAGGACGGSAEAVASAPGSASGSWIGQRPSTADYVKGPETTPALMLTMLN